MDWFGYGPIVAGLVGAHVLAFVAWIAMTVWGELRQPEETSKHDQKKD